MHNSSSSAKEDISEATFKHSEALSVERDGSVTVETITPSSRLAQMERTFVSSAAAAVPMSEPDLYGQRQHAIESDAWIRSKLVDFDFLKSSNWTATLHDSILRQHWTHGTRKSVPICGRMASSYGLYVAQKRVQVFAPPPREPLRAHHVGITDAAARVGTTAVTGSTANFVRRAPRRMMPYVLFKM
jgi:hypothetical protein